MSTFHGITRPDVPRIPQDLATKVYIDDLINNKILFGKVVKQVTEVLNDDDTTQNDDELFIENLLPNTRYAFYLQVFMQSDAVADIKTGFSVPAGAIGRVLSGNFNANVPQAVVGLAVTAKAVSNALEKVMSFTGHVGIAGTGGTMQFQWAQNTATAINTSVFFGSHFLMWEQQ